MARRSPLVIRLALSNPDDRGDDAVGGIVRACCEIETCRRWSTLVSSVAKFDLQRELQQLNPINSRKLLSLDRNEQLNRPGFVGGSNS